MNPYPHIKKDQMEYDYIIAGAGCAGLSLLHRMLSTPSLQSKRMLVLDKSKKVTNDRTWCFWEKGAGYFESIVTHEWRTLQFLNSDFTQEFDLEAYSYKMIRGIDFYNYIIDFAKQFENVTFKYESIRQIQSTSDYGMIETDKATYSSKYIFNSTPFFNPKIDITNSLLQHFEGWVIQTERPTFNCDVGTLMDFRLDQDNGATFMYVLPTSSREALVEYTLFSEKVLKEEAYKAELENYIQAYLQIKDYKIIHKEAGIIPMSLAKFSRKIRTADTVINVGTAGGFTKASSGYTFQFIQKNTDLIIDRLIKNELPNPNMTFRDKMFQWYDRTLLDVIISNKMSGKEIFSIMFQKIPPEKILAFLGNESSFWDDLKIMLSLPMAPFLTSGIRQLFSYKNDPEVSLNNR